MKREREINRERGFTRVDALVTIIVITMIVTTLPATIVPAMNRAREAAMRRAALINSKR